MHAKRSAVWGAVAVIVAALPPVLPSFSAPQRVAYSAVLILIVSGSVVALRDEGVLERVKGRLEGFLHRERHEEQLQKHHETQRGIAELPTAILKALNVGDGVSALTRGAEPQTTREDYDRLRWLWSFVGAWAWSAKQMLNRDEWPQKVTIDKEQDWMNSAISLDQFSLRGLHVSGVMMLPEPYHGRVFLPEVSQWAEDAAPARGAHTALFCKSYTRMTKQHEALVELEALLKKEARIAAATLAEQPDA